MTSYEGLYNQITLQPISQGGSMAVPSGRKKFFIFSHINSIVVFLTSVFDKVHSRRRRIKDTSIDEYNRKDKKRMNFKKYIKPVVLVLVIVGIVWGGKLVVDRLIAPVDTQGQKTSVMGAKAQEDLNKEFKFPLRDKEGEEVERFTFEIGSVELRDEIVVKGQKATAVNGRTFLIINLKLTNPYKDPIEIDTRDYVRLSVNGNKDERLAPDIHNDPVEVQAISTKLTRLGFPINDSDKDLVLRIGEIDGDKEEVPLELK